MLEYAQAMCDILHCVCKDKSWSYAFIRLACLRLSIAMHAAKACNKNDLLNLQLSTQAYC